MSKWMNLKGHGMMPGGLLLLGAVLATSAGCSRPAKCDDPGVVCADELDQHVRLIPGSAVQTGFDFVAEMAFTSSDATAANTKNYKIQGQCEPQDGWMSGPGYAGGYKAFHGWYAFWMKGDGPVRCEAELSDTDPTLGTSQKVAICIDAQGKQQDCKTWAAAPLPDPLIVTNNNAANVAPKVSCGKLTYRVTQQETSTGNVDWRDLTWTVQSPNGYDLTKAPTARGYRYTLFQLGPFSSKPGDTSEMLGKAPESFALPTKLAARKATELRLPLRISAEELVNSAKTNTDVLRAGWAFTDESSGKEVNIGCAIKQTVLVKILETALAGQPVGDQTVHILFNSSSDKQPVGENGWCYGLTAAGQSPLFKPYRSTETGKLCDKYP